MTRDSKPNLNLPIYEQAADWLLELREGDLDAVARERLDAWFRASPEHIRAYLELSSLWEEGADPYLDRTHSTQELIARARETSNVIPLSANIEPQQPSAEALMNERSATSPTAPSNDSRYLSGESAAQTVGASSASPTRSTTQPPPPVSSGDSQGRAWPHRFSRRRPLWFAAAVGACVLASASLYLSAQRNLFETGVGEQRFVKLIDGSTVELNSRSRVRIRYSDTERDVDLIEGQALFHVAHDAARPFIVHSGTTLVRAVGTQFDVYRKESGTTVTVVEGRVAVLSPMLTAQPSLDRMGADQTGSNAAPQHAPPSALARDSYSGSASGSRDSRSGFQGSAASSDPSGSATVYLVAGEQIIVSAGAPPRATHADASVATAWTQHELVFDSTSLIEVAQDFNRYNTRQLIVSDAALRDFHITGVFSSADPASLLKFLRAQRDIIVEETDDGIHVSKR
jgi:transmembrane sensor